MPGLVWDHVSGGCSLEQIGTEPHSIFHKRGKCGRRLKGRRGPSCWCRVAERPAVGGSHQTASLA